MPIGKEQLLKQFTQQVLDERISLFMGAGGSCDAGYSNWANLFLPVARDLGTSIDESTDYYIIMNDYVMERLGQTVSRYVISTCGVSGFIPALIQDIKSGVFRNKVTIHLSLHDIDDARNEIMPINRDNDYKEALEYCKALYSITKEKIGVGILMFDQYQSGEIKNRTLTQERLEKILSVLDNEIFRIDLCAVNKTSIGEQKHQLSNEIASNLCETAKQKGFEVKLFASFGDSQQSGCGMLSSSTDDLETAGKNTIAHFNNSVLLLHEAKQYYFENLRKA